MELTLGRIVIALTKIPEYWGLLLDVIEKMGKPDFARELAKFARREACWVVNVLKVVINRSEQFNPSQFIDAGWAIWKGPVDGDGLTGEEEQDARSLDLTEVDLSQVSLKNMLRPGESYITGTEKLRRLVEAGLIRLDAGIFWHLWRNQHLIPESWKELVNGNTQFIYFEGTILRRPGGDRCVLCLYWNDGKWRWGVRKLYEELYVNSISAILASA